MRNSGSSMLSAMEAPSTPVREEICLPKISVPAFDGYILQWKSFWEQFELYLYNRAKLSDAIKLAYLKDAVKDGPPLNIIEGLAQTAENCNEDVNCLLHHYDRPCLIHQAHIHGILNISLLIDCNGKELRQFHDIANQHLSTEGP